MKNGFTLVELSIVLVIIGLLIGGILVGQSLIDSAKANRFVQTFQMFDIAYNQFIARHKQKPGDYSKRLATLIGPNPATVVDGDGDGDIEWYGESKYFWSDMIRAGVLNMDETKALATHGSEPAAWAYGYLYADFDEEHGAYDYITAPHPPLFVARTGGFPNYDNSWNPEVPGTNILGDMMMYASNESSAINRGAITPGDSFNIDAKMDDGIPGEGDIRGHQGAIIGAGGGAAGVNGSCWEDIGGSVYRYDLDEDRKACRLHYLFEGR